MKPRSYQTDAVDSIFNYFASGGVGNPVVVMPTGVGKSLVIGEFIRRAMFQYPSTRIMKLTHSKTLIKQNLEKLKALWPSAPAGVYSAGLGKKELGFPIVFGGIGSVAKADLSIFGRIDLMIIDECHLLSQNENTMYRKVIAGLLEINPYLKVIGLTATHFRLGQGLIIDDGLFTDICIDMSSMQAFNWFLDQGYLAKLIPKRTKVELDVSGVHISAGEYKQNELQLSVDKDEITHAACQEMVEHGQDRKCWLIFASGIEHTEHVAAMLNNFGIKTTYVHSKMPAKEQDKNMADYKAGRFQAMVNNGILTTGFDHPGIDLMGILRPTTSPGLWVQILGRGTRPDYEPGYDLETMDGRLAAISNSSKRDCLVLDFAGNTKRLGPINDPVIPHKKGKGGGGTAPVKECPVCQTWNHASVRFCISCGAEFPKQTKITYSAGTEALIATDEIKTETFKVDKVVYNLHRKEDRPDSIKSNYYCGLRVFSSYICLEHGGFASKKARDFWREAAPGKPVPTQTAQAMEMLNDLRTPSVIRVWLKTKYSEIMNYEYEQNTDELENP